jgi:hypothetical protein
VATADADAAGKDREAAPMMDAVLASRVMDSVVAITVEALLRGDDVIEIPRQQLCAVAQAWATYSREPNQLLAERAAASEFCALVEDRLRAVAVDAAVAERFHEFADKVDREFPERRLH